MDQSSNETKFLPLENTLEQFQVISFINTIKFIFRKTQDISALSLAISQPNLKKFSTKKFTHLSQVCR